MNLKLEMLNHDQLQYLCKKFDEFNFPYDTNLIYQHQVPNTALILLEGTIELKNRRLKQIDIVHPGMIVGVYNLIKNIPLKFNCMVKGNSKLILLSKSDILKIMNEESSEMFQILTKKTKFKS